MPTYKFRVPTGGKPGYKVVTSLSVGDIPPVTHLKGVQVLCGENPVQITVDSRLSFKCKNWVSHDVGFVPYDRVKKIKATLSAPYESAVLDAIKNVVEKLEEETGLAIVWNSPWTSNVSGKSFTTVEASLKTYESISEAMGDWKAEEADAKRDGREIPPPPDASSKKEGDMRKVRCFPIVTPKSVDGSIIAVAKWDKLGLAKSNFDVLLSGEGSKNNLFGETKLSIELKKSLKGEIMAVFYIVTMMFGCNKPRELEVVADDDKLLKLAEADTMESIE